jgi:hypothetical protein
MDMQLLQVGCPEARIDENVAKLTGAGYKVSLHKLLGPVVCIRPFAVHTATCRSSLHTALCSPILQHAEVVCIWPSAIHTATCRSGLQDVPASTSAQLMACDLFCANNKPVHLACGTVQRQTQHGCCSSWLCT